MLYPPPLTSAVKSCTWMSTVASAICGTGAQHKGRDSVPAPPPPLALHTCESGTQSCVSDQRPGPQPGSDSSTRKDTAAQSVLPSVPTKKAGHSKMP